MSADLIAHVQVSAWLNEDASFETDTHEDGFCHHVKVRGGMADVCLSLSTGQVRALYAAVGELLADLDGQAVA